jgi:hypothetical protein
MTIMENITFKCLTHLASLQCLEKGLNEVDFVRSYYCTTIFVQVVCQILPYASFSDWSIDTVGHAMRWLTKVCCLIIARCFDNWRLGAVSLLCISTSWKNHYSMLDLLLALTMSSADGGVLFGWEWYVTIWPSGSSITSQLLIPYRSQNSLWRRSRLLRRFRSCSFLTRVKTGAIFRMYVWRNHQKFE